MIASRSKAVRHGPGRLVVDGRDTHVRRRTVFAINPTRSQQTALLACLDATREVYNAALQHRRDAWRVAEGTVTVFDQFTALTGIRRVRPDLFTWGLQVSSGPPGPFARPPLASLARAPLMVGPARGQARTAARGAAGSGPHGGAVAASGWVQGASV